MKEKNLTIFTKGILIVLLVVITSNKGHSQSLKISFLNHISEISFYSMDDIMISGYGYTKMQDENSRERNYAKIINNDPANFISIKIINSFESPHRVLMITCGPGFVMNDFKEELISNEFKYQGLNEIDCLVYKKSETTILITKEPRDNGSNQVLMFID